MLNIFIDGQEGTTGLKLCDKLAGRKDINLLKIAEDKRKDVTARAELLNAADLAFLCLPDAAAVEAVGLVNNNHTRIIDASTAHRTLPGWVYGFPELTKDGEAQIKNAMRVAVPGCHASGFLAIVKPLVAAGILAKDATICCTSLTGYSGGGKKMIAEYEAQNKNFMLLAPRPYALGQTHKHLKEMKFVAELTREPIFQPIVFDFFSGMAVSIPLDLSMLKAQKEDVFNVLSSHYLGQELVRVSLDEGESISNGAISANALYGRDDMEIVVNGNSQNVIVTAVFDNLGKGASGQAVECMNLMLGIKKTTGLLYKENI
ncbi:MAG: N-acetyl-gamma-glutamyl-phosphate reductase [Clostridia bacterium]